MSEKIYACLMRLFPWRFREAYGDEALQLFRDRARDEQGFFPQIHLWLDLLADFAISVPRMYRGVRPALAGAAGQQRLQGAPAFFVLVQESPGPGALVFGCALTMMALSLFATLLGYAGSHRSQSAPAYQRAQATDSRPSSLEHPAMQTPGDVENPFLNAASPNDLPARALLPPDSSRLREGRPGQLLGPAERKRLMHAVIDNLEKHYVDPEIARKTADALLAHEKNGDDDSAADGGAFADLLTKQIREVSQDLHLEVVYSQEPLPDLLAEPTADELARYRKALEQDNCTFEKVEILSHNIGYLKLNAFPDASFCQATAEAAMATVNHADAVIFDLRDNRGGYANMVSLIAGYLFDHPEYLYDPRASPAPQSWTHSPVAGNRLADKPVYVLTSGSTASAAEQFCYDLKMLKRVTLVGERTRGSAHAGVFHRIDEHFGMGIPEARVINPFGKTDWAVTGVEPDVKVKAAEALEAARNLAEERLRKK